MVWIGVSIHDRIGKAVLGAKPEILFIVLQNRNQIISGQTVLSRKRLKFLFFGIEIIQSLRSGNPYHPLGIQPKFCDTIPLKSIFMGSRIIMMESGIHIDHINTVSAPDPQIAFPIFRKGGNILVVHLEWIAAYGEAPEVFVLPVPKI